MGRAHDQPQLDRAGGRRSGAIAAIDTPGALAPRADRGRAVTLLVADNAPTRLGIRMALPAEVVICAEADAADQAIRAARRFQPDICLIGRQLLGAQFTPVIGVCRAAPQCSVIVLAAEENAGDMIEALRAGALGYVPGGLTAERLVAVTRAVADREAIVPRSLTRELVLAVRDDASQSTLLTGREAEVLRMLRRGESTIDIATRLRIAPVTVRRHVSELVRKLGVSDRVELTRDPLLPEVQEVSRRLR